MRFVSKIDATQIAMSRTVFEISATDPSTPVLGRYYYNSTDNSVRFYSGTSWVSIANSVITAHGDLVIGGSSGESTRLPVGSENQVLTVVGGTPTWSSANSQLRIRTYSVGDGVLKTFTINHNLGTTSLIPACRELTTGDYVLVDFRTINANSISVGPFDVAPSSNQYEVILMG